MGSPLEKTRLEGIILNLSIFSLARRYCVRFLTSFIKTLLSLPYAIGIIAHRHKGEPATIALFPEPYCPTTRMGVSFPPASLHDISTDASGFGLTGTKPISGGISGSSSAIPSMSVMGLVYPSPPSFGVSSPLLKAIGSTNSTGSALESARSPELPSGVLSSSKMSIEPPCLTYCDRALPNSLLRRGPQCISTIASYARSASGDGEGNLRFLSPPPFFE